MPMISVGNPGGGPSDLGIVFNDLPVAEAEADSDSAVCEFTGGAAANDLLVGGGLTGADLVLTQHGSIPGAADGGRLITAATGQYFSPTADMINSFADNDGGFSVVYRCSNLTQSGRVCAVALSGQTCAWYAQAANYARLDSRVSGASDSTAAQVAVSPPSLPLSDIFWHIFSLDYATGLGFSGIAVCDALPNRVSDFLGVSVFYDAAKTYTPTATLDSSLRAIVGTSYSSNPAALFKIRAFTISKKPFASLR